MKFLGDCKELWIPLHQALKDEMRGWEVTPPWTLVQNAKGRSYSTDRFREAWTRLMNTTPAGRIRQEGYTFHGFAGLERGELARGRLRRSRHRIHYRHVVGDGDPL